MAPKSNKQAERKSPSNKRGRGRPTVYHPDFVDEARRRCLQGAVETELADIFGVSITTIRNWKVQYPDFLAATKLGKNAADDRVEHSLYHRAIGYTHDAVKIFPPRPGETEPVIVKYREHIPPDTNAARLWLLNRRSAEWRDRQEITGKDGASLLGDKTLEEVRAELVAEFIALGLTADLARLPDAPKLVGSDRGVAGRKRET